jgi:hypothetical protein
MPVLGGCQILTLEAPLIAEKSPCMYNGYIYSKDDVRSPFVKPPWLTQSKLTMLRRENRKIRQENEILKSEEPAPCRNFRSIECYQQTYVQISWDHPFNKEKNLILYLGKSYVHTRSGKAYCYRSKLPLTYCYLFLNLAVLFYSISSIPTKLDENKERIWRWIKTIYIETWILVCCIKFPLWLCNVL